MNRDFMGIVLEVGQSSKDTEMRRLYEDVRDGKFVDMSVYNISKDALNESASEPLSYQGLAVVKEKFGRGVSLKSGDTEFRFVSDKYNADELEHRMNYLLEHQESEKVQSWLAGNTLCYLTQSLSEETLDEGVMSNRSLEQDFQIGDVVLYKKELWVVDDPSEEQRRVRIVQPDKQVAVVPESELTPAGGAQIPKRILNLSKKAIQSKTRLFESTQAGDVATKTDSSSLNKTPVEGVAYEFEDGVFVVDSIEDGVVYLIGPDDEYYSISVEDFEKEVIASLDEAELDYEVQVEKDVNKAFSGWIVEKVNDDTDKTGIVMYAVSNGENDVVVFVHLGEETYEIYSDSDDEAPEYEGKLEDIKSDLNKMAKYFK